MAEELYKPGQKVPSSGVYRVMHDKIHAANHEVTAIKGEPFPPCNHCGDRPRFKLVKATIHVKHHHLFLDRPRP